MFKPTVAGLLAAVICLISCKSGNRSETEEVSYWNQKFIDSSFRLLYKHSDTALALRYFDSSIAVHRPSSVYPAASRFGILANYFYFFSTDNAATSAMIDSSLCFYNREQLQDQYPRSYVGLLLFGGHIAYRLNQYTKANEYYFRAKKLGDTHLNPCERSAFSYNIAMVLYRQKNFTSSLQNFKQAYELQNSCAVQTTAIALQQQEIQSNIGLCYIELKEYDQALKHFDRALEIAYQYRDSLGAVTMEKIEGVIAGNRAQVFLHRNQMDSAEKFCLRGIRLNDREGYEKDFAQGVKLLLAEVYQKKKNFSAMHATLMDAGNKIPPGAVQLEINWNKLMAEYEENQGNTEKSVHYLKKYFHLRDSFANQQKRLIAADANRQLRENEQAFEIGILRKEKEHANLLMIAAILFSCMTIAIIYLTGQHYRRSRKNLIIQKALNEEIRLQKQAKEEEIHKRHQLITEAVISAQENERSLIGLELHDNINQVLTTVKLHNEMVLDGVCPPKEILPRTLHHLQDCINEIRALSKRLSAPTLGKISIEDSVKDLIASINTTSKVKITHHFSGLQSMPLNKEMHLGIYRILQEGLNNVLKHSEASDVVLQIEKGEEGILLSLSDNGKGFSMAQNKAGIGLMNMQTRAENLNGMFELNSEPGKGCCMKVVLPWIDHG